MGLENGVAAIDLWLFDDYRGLYSPNLTNMVIMVGNITIG